MVAHPPSTSARWIVHIEGRRGADDGWLPDNELEASDLRTAQIVNLRCVIQPQAA
ncbi:MAG TPA: hypothetical protein VFF65_03345 [Phycisphaerales bacterium]|nr:hypothetical protein [Phycisphaerales bacterium]